MAVEAVYHFHMFHPHVTPGPWWLGLIPIAVATIYVIIKSILK